MRDRKLGMVEGSCPGEIEEQFVYTDPYHGNIFLKKLHEFYMTERLCDVKLRIEDQVIHTHKSVLAANSPYFEGMFMSGLMEAVQDTIEIKGISYEILRALVEFCYTASVKVHTDNALELLSGANMFQFQGIKQCCSTYLQSKLDPHNCLNIAIFADRHTCYNLKECAEDYSKTHFRDVTRSDEFLEIPLEQLKHLLANDSLTITSEKDVFDAAVTWIQYDEARRKQYFSELLALVRMVHLSPKILIDCIENHPYVESKECIKLISDAKTFQLLPKHQDVTSVDHTKPRMPATDSCIYVIGGETRSEVFDSVDCFSFSDSKWRQISRMSEPRDGLGVTTYGGKIYAAGGYNGNVALTTCACYTPEKDSWQNIASMNFPRHAFSMTELDGWLYAAGGSDFVATEYNSVERYDPIRDEWLNIESMSGKREGLVLVPYERVIYALGGENGVSILNTVERYDPRTGIWYNCAAMGYRRRYFGAAVLNGKIYSVGGSDYEEDLNTVEVFEARYNRWIPIPSMNKRRESLAVVAIEQKIFAMGGACVNRETDSIECYDPMMNKWEEFGVITRAKEGMGAVVL